jgi:hypothetical protein
MHQFELYQENSRLKQFATDTRRTIKSLTHTQSVLMPLERHQRLLLEADARNS